MTKFFCCLGPYVAGSCNFALNYDDFQPAEIQPYNSAFIPEATWLLASLVHLVTASCALTGLAMLVGTILNYIVFKG